MKEGGGRTEGEVGRRSSCGARRVPYNPRKDLGSSRVRHSSHGSG